jgi:hypothetical protein
LARSAKTSRPAVSSQRNGRSGLGRILQNAPHEVETVVASKVSEPRFGLILGWKCSYGIRSGVGRIRDDEIVGDRRQVFEQIGLEGVNPQLKAVVADVAVGNHQRIAGEVACVDFGVGKRLRSKDRKAARAGAEVEDTRDRGPFGMIADRRPCARSSPTNERGTITRSST